MSRGMLRCYKDARTDDEAMRKLETNPITTVLIYSREVAIHLSHRALLFWSVVSGRRIVRQYLGTEPLDSL